MASFIKIGPVAMESISNKQLVNRSKVYIYIYIYIYNRVFQKVLRHTKILYLSDTTAI